MRGLRARAKRIFGCAACLCRVAVEYSRHTEKDYRDMERREEGSLAHYPSQSIQTQKGNNNGSTNIITTPMIICNGSPTFM